MGVSLATAERYWAFARTWLFAELEGARRPTLRRKNHLRA